MIPSKTNPEFRRRFEKLPFSVQRQARQNYRLWRADSRHPSLDYKQVHSSRPYYSVRIGLHWRAVGRKRDDGIIWFWIGPHAAYDTLLKKL